MGLSQWFSLHCHSFFSSLDGLSSPQQIADRLVECGHAGSALTDHGVLGGVPSFIKALSKAGKKAIAGIEFYLCQQDASLKTKENARLHHLCVLAKGQQGWLNLIKASSDSNRTEHFYRKPRLSLEQLGKFAGGELIAFSGHPGSALANVFFTEPKLSYRATSYEEAKSLVRPDWVQRATEEVERHWAAFGKENFFLEIQLIDRDNLPVAQLLADGLRWLGRKLGVRCVATADSHYARQEDAPDQRILLATAFRTTIKEVERQLANDEDVTLGAFFRSSRYHIPSLEEMRELHTLDELQASVDIAERCQTPTVTRPPQLPVFSCPDGLSNNEYLKTLARAGWKKTLSAAQQRNPVYAERIKMELDVVERAGLAGYFLIVHDFVQHAREKLRCKTGRGRGSAAGCLLSYLLGITKVDPIKFDLLFERFFNAGRLSEGRVALPDIDMDFPAERREAVIDYIRQKYGVERVGQMATFARLQGRAALKAVLRAHERCSFAEMDEITKLIPEESRIADHLQEMEDPSIVRWSLENIVEPLRPWCFLKEDGSLDGPLALDFEQAIRLEGTVRGTSRHASGVIISAEPLAGTVPMIYNPSTGLQLVGLDMRDCEAAGLVKFDILGVSVLQKIMDAEAIIRTGHV